MTAKKKPVVDVTAPKTHVIVLLDRSGSMASIRQQAVVWYNEQVQQLKENAKTQNIEVSLISFNGDVFEHLWRKPAEELQEASIASYEPNGMTSLRDAMGYAVDKAMSEDEKDLSYLFVVISDGDDTSSSKYNKTMLREIFQGIEANQRWTHNFIGCESNVILKELATVTGVDMSNMAKAAYDNIAGAAAHTNKRAKKYWAARGAGVQKVDNFHSDELGVSADYAYTSALDGDLDADDVAVFKRVSLPQVRTIQTDGVVAGNFTGGTADVFMATSQNCVVSGRLDYNRPQWKS